MNPIPGRGFWGWGRGWFGRGGGRGWRHWFYATGLPGWMRARIGYPAFGRWNVPYNYGELTPKEEMEILKEQSEFLKEQLEEIQKRMNNLEKEQAQEQK
jgi:hypothetical protein